MSMASLKAAAPASYIRDTLRAGSEKPRQATLVLTIKDVEKGVQLVGLTMYSTLHPEKPVAQIYVGSDESIVVNNKGEPKTYTHAGAVVKEAKDNFCVPGVRTYISIECEAHEVPESIDHVARIRGVIGDYEAPPESYPPGKWRYTFTAADSDALESLVSDDLDDILSAISEGMTERGHNAVMLQNCETSDIYDPMEINQLLLSNDRVGQMKEFDDG